MCFLSLILNISGHVNGKLFFNSVILMTLDYAKDTVPETIITVKSYGLKFTYYY